MTKRRLRKLYLNRQMSLSESERTQKSEQIKNVFFEHIDLTPVTNLHIFLSILTKGEIDTGFILSELRERYPEITITVPRVDFENDVLEHLALSPETKLDVNHWGISEPTGENLIDEEEIDLVLVPLLCFDERGFRVGHGKGYYDKFLSRCSANCLKVGMSFFAPVKIIENIQEFDVKLDRCLTPRRVWDFG